MIIPLTKQLMADEFGANPTTLAKAADSIRAQAEKLDDLERGKELLDTSECAYLLARCGLIEAFALYCVRLGGARGWMEILPAFTGAPLDDIVRITAEFDSTGVLASMRGKVYLLPLPDAPWCNPERFNGPPSVITVVRYPLSPSQAYRKMIEERWHDPDLEPSVRLVCELDRNVYDAAERMACEGKEQAESEAGQPKPKEA